MKSKHSHAGQFGRAMCLIAGAALVAPHQGMAGIGDVDSGEVQVDLAEYKSVQLRPGQDPDLALAIALPGGGHRSSNGAAGVLLALEKMGLLMEIDYFSTVSGGGCPTGVFIAALRDHLLARSAPESFSFAATMQNRPGGKRGRTVEESLATNYQKEILRKGLLHDLVPGNKDRGDHFETFLDDEVTRGLKFGDMMKPRDGGESPTLPYWFPVAAIDRSAAILALAPDIFASYLLTDYRHRGKTLRFGGDYFDVPVSVALKASMSFPIAVPPSVFKSSMHADRPYIHLKDGGLVDNVGAFTALSLLRQDRAKRKVLIVVDVNITQFDPWAKDTKAGGIAKQAFDASRIGIDTQVHRYREQMVDHDIHHDADGRIRCGKTREGIEVIFLYPELLSAAAAREVKAVGTTLKLERDEQEMLLGAGWEMARVQHGALCGIAGHDLPITDIGGYSTTQAAIAGVTGTKGAAGKRGGFFSKGKFQGRAGKGGRGARW